MYHIKYTVVPGIWNKFLLKLKPNIHFPGNQLILVCTSYSPCFILENHEFDQELDDSD